MITLLCAVFFFFFKSDLRWPSLNSSTSYCLCMTASIAHAVNKGDCVQAVKGQVADDLDPPLAVVRGMARLVDSLKVAFAEKNATVPAHDAADVNGGSVNWDKGSVAGAATFHDGQKVVAVVEAIKRSSIARQWVPVHVSSEQDQSDRISVDGGSLSAPYYPSH